MAIASTSRATHIPPGRDNGRTAGDPSGAAQWPAPTGSVAAGSIGEASQMWNSLPAQLANLFQPHARGIARAVLQHVQQSVPDYARPLEGAFGQHVTHAVEHAVRQCIESIRTPNAPKEDWAQVFRNLGKVEFQQGRSLDTLQSAYRVGGRAAWRYIAEVAQKHRVPFEYVRVAAEAIFAYIEELSALSVEGFTAAQTHDVGTVARRRRRLLELILSDAVISSPQALSALADAARWQLPEQITAVALEPRADQHEIATPVLGRNVLMDLEGAEPCLLTADPETDLTDLAENLAGWRAAVGPKVALTDARTSLEWARATVRMVQQGVIPDAPVTWSTRHLSTIWLLKDEFFVSQLCTRVLEPLEALTPKQRQRLSETLLAWLQLSGSAPEIAGRLGIHPQTVRYRLRQLENLFGDGLWNVDHRLDLELALRAERLAQPERTT